MAGTTGSALSGIKDVLLQEETIYISTVLKL
jgi:hypothetical protein